MKIDDLGNYCNFRGITTVSSVQKGDFSIWKNLFDQLTNCSFLSKYFTLLPVSSYHMTLINLYTEEKDAKNITWKEFVKQKNEFFQQIFKRFDKENIQPIITIESMVIDLAIQLVVSLPKEQQAIIHEVANTFNLNDHVPEKFHITLGYQYQWYETGDEALEVNHYLQTILSEFQNKNPCFTLEKSRLCYFNDMTAFIPWDGKGFPFNVSPEVSIHGLFKSRSSNDTEENSPSNCILS